VPPPVESRSVAGHSSNEEHAAMSDQPTASSPPPPAPEPTVPAGPNYLDYLRQIFLDTDRFFDDRKRGLMVFGLINMSALVALLALGTFFQRIGASTGGMRFAWLMTGIKLGLAIAVPLAIAVFVLNWYSSRQGSARGIDFFVEKLGAALALPLLLLVVALPFGLIGATLHSWFHGAALVFVYIAIFVMAYLYAAPRRLQVATLFALGFYLTYRLIWLLL
jgi:hypothetical protein